MVQEIPLVAEELGGRAHWEGCREVAKHGLWPGVLWSVVQMEVFLIRALGIILGIMPVISRLSLTLRACATSRNDIRASLNLTPHQALGSLSHLPILPASFSWFAWT